MRTWPVVLWVLVAVGALPVCAQIQVEQGVPAGFEQLDTPRATVIILTYGGKRLGPFSAHYTSDSLSFDDVDAVLAAVPELLHKEKVADALQGALPVHAGLLCRASQSEGCGVLSPEIAGVIFDETNLLAELFIHQDYLGVQELTTPRYLPLPERQFSSVYNINGAVAGVDMLTPNFTLSSNAIMAFGEGRFTTQSSLTNDGLRFDTAAASIDREGLEGVAGLFRSRGMQLVSDRDIAGISVATSIRTRLDQRKMAGNDIILYLPRRSLVSIYREGRLYSSRAYEAGNQAIDTSELPEGAYNITLKIQESGGMEREEVRFLAKSPDLPPPDMPTYYAQAGVVRKPASSDSMMPEFSRRPLLRLGTVRRVGENTGLDVGLVGIEEQAALEAGTFLIYSGMQLRVTGLVASDGAYGAQMSYLQMADKWNATIDARSLWGGEEPSMDNPDPLLRTLAQVTSTINYAVTENLTVGLSGSYVSQGNGPLYWSAGPLLEWYIWRSDDSMLSFNADAGQGSNGAAANAYLRFTKRFGSYGVTGMAGYNHGRMDRGAAGNIRLWHEEATPDHALLLGAGVQADEKAQSISLDADMRNRIGRGQALVEQRHDAAGDSMQYSGNFIIGAAQLDGDVQIGGTQTDMSAVIVEMAGDAKTPMRIMVGGVEYGTMQAGERHTIYLAPYATYDIRLTTVKSDMVDYDSASRRVTLYPGNVVRLQWEVNPFQVVLGTLHDDQGAPVSGAVLQEKTRDMVVTDIAGRFQAQISSQSQLTFRNADETLCMVHLPDSAEAVNGVVIYREPLLCEAAHLISQSASQ